MASAFDAWQVELHGHRVIYRIAGSGPPVVLIHGMVNSSRHWEDVAMRLADRYTVIAPDLIGHGDSATPRGDYSLGPHAASIRDLLAVIRVDHATIVGHSLGGGVAMQFFYQFPQRTDRLVPISSGGLGREVSPLLRGAALPGAAAILRAAAHRRVLDVHGQRVSARDRLYLLRSYPTLIVWGVRDNTIPLSHGEAAHHAIPGSRFVTLPRAAHFPHLEDPDGLAQALDDFI